MPIAYIININNNIQILNEMFNVNKNSFIHLW